MAAPKLLNVSFYLLPLLEKLILFSSSGTRAGGLM